MWTHWPRIPSRPRLTLARARSGVSKLVSGYQGTTFETGVDIRGLVSFGTGVVWKGVWWLFCDSKNWFKLSLNFSWYRTYE